MEVWDYEEDDEEPIARDLKMLIANPDAGSDDWSSGDSDDGTEDDTDDGTEDGTDDGTEDGTDDGTEGGTDDGTAESEGEGMDGQEGNDCWMSNPGSYTDMLKFIFFGGMS